MSKYTIPFERCWLIRSPASGNGPFATGKPLFWVAANQWNSSPVAATIFPSEEAAQRQIDDARHYKRAGFTAGSIVEAVPLEGAAKTLGTPINLDDLRGQLGDRP